MAGSGNPLYDIFLAGVGALSIGAEKSKEIASQLVERGKQSVEEGKNIVSDIDAKTQEKATAIKEDIISAHLKTLTPEQREEFAARIASLVAEANAPQAQPAEAAAEEAPIYEVPETDVEKPADEPPVAENESSQL